MQESVLRKLFLGFIQIHILHHAKNEPFFGSWMIEELKKHGYEVSSGTIYPILHNMEKLGLLYVENKTSGEKYENIIPSQMMVLKCLIKPKKR